LSITSGAEATVAPDEYSIAGKKPFSLKADLQKKQHRIHKQIGTMRITYS